MRKLTLIFCFILFGSQALFSQHKLTIAISPLKNSKGLIHVELKDENEKMIDGYQVDISDNSCILVIENLKPGRYSFQYIHDENSNKELDTNLIGMPKEGFGYSNNAKGKFGPPDFEDTIFEIKGDLTQKCTPIYL